MLSLPACSLLTLTPSIDLSDIVKVLDMKICYFADIDTAVIEFASELVADTKEKSENLYIDLDDKGNLVSMTIEHAKEKTNISEISYLQMNSTAA